MARQFGTNIDLLLNQILNGRFQILAADPAAPVEGQFWYNSTAKVFRYRTDAATLSIGDDSAALALKANINSPSFTGDPTTVTPAAGDNDQSIPTTAWVRARIAELIGTAPGVLDTLGELSDALGDDANFAATITALVNAKAGKYTTTIGGSAAQVVTHNLNTRAVVVSVHDAATFDEIEVDVQKTSVNTVTIGFATAPPAASRVVTVIG